MKHPRVLPVLLFACLGSGLGVASASANEVVILQSGNRLEVESALPTARGDWQLKLSGGGTILLPATAVRRVSNSAADLPRTTAPQIAKSGDGWTPAATTTSSEPSEIPASIPREAIRPVPGRFQGAAALRAPGMTPGNADGAMALADPSAEPRTLTTGIGGPMRAPDSLAAQARNRSVASAAASRFGGFRRSTRTPSAPSGASNPERRSLAAPSSGGNVLPRFKG